MQKNQFPLNFSFKISTLSNDFVAKDASGNTIAYVRQKMLKLIDEIVVFNNESKSETLYTLKANKWIDFSAAYNFMAVSSGLEIGKIARKGWASIWKAHYEIFDKNAVNDMIVREEKPWVKVSDALFSEIPIIGIFTGYVFHPSYIVSRADGTQLVRLKKESSFLGRQFTVTQLADFKTGEEERIVLGLMMMILLERRRG
ncbi:hypothetical protein [Sediminibacterium sp.]|uniref:hypothetical protein n=1 Tax=Sediminibacterium sp. TaxID=1917865 RepID=UPI0027156865|nr:hypothetical protein [Sediminibacterium sp.]MDO9000416.1 hypothetical protein [Bacteroidota bacterium]MDP3147016.1 hypothetical protein [Bacteroidota bacterium]MDP3567447.1 hypothetical protein [Sediminibacterium sp.]